MQEINKSSKLKFQQRALTCSRRQAALKKQILGILKY
jgi:hypothetical protein